MGGARMNLQLYKNVEDKPSGPIVILQLKF